MSPKLSRLQAYKAMYVYLDHIWRRDYSGDTSMLAGDLPSLLGSMSLLADGSSADSSYLQRWNSTIDSIGKLGPGLDPNHKAQTGNLITQEQVFYAMHSFIEHIACEINSNELMAILRELVNSKNSGNKEDHLLLIWQSSLNDTLDGDPDINLKFV